MTIFVLSVAGWLAVNQEISMLRTLKKPTKTVTPKLVAVIKNGHTNTELDEMEERWVNHQGPYLTLAEVIAIEKAKQNAHPDKP